MDQKRSIGRDKKNVQGIKEEEKKKRKKKTG